MGGVSRGREAVIRAFLQGRTTHVGNYETDGLALRLFGNAIAMWSSVGGTELLENSLLIRDAGWQTVTTKASLNHLLRIVQSPYRIVQRQKQWYICERGELWTHWGRGLSVPVYEREQGDMWS